MTMFFNKLNLAPMQEHLSYKNVDKMSVLLIKLPYSKIIWWIKSLSIYSVTIDITSKEILIYYLDIILAVQFLIDHQPFAIYLAYVLIQRYLTDNQKNSQLDNKDKQIYREMYTTD